MNNAIRACPQCNTRVRIPSRASGHPRCPKCKTDLPWLVEIDESEFSSSVLSAPIPVLVDCWAPWCQPCVAFTPELEKTAVGWAGKLKVVKINVDEAPAVSEKYGVRSIPTVLLFRDGELIAERAGASNASVLNTWISSALDKQSKG